MQTIMLHKCKNDKCNHHLINNTKQMFEVIVSQWKNDVTKNESTVH